MAYSVAALALAIWLYLLLGRGGFWRSRDRDDADVLEPTPSRRLVARASVRPRVTVVIPARDEAESIGETIASLLVQDYPGESSIILVDDGSSDGTAAVARAAAVSAGPNAAARLEVIAGSALPPGWTGKLWALAQGVEAARHRSPPPDYLLLTDADIVYQPDVLAGLVARAEANWLVLVSLMVKLRCESLAERALVPAFIFFFQMLYPFAWVNRADSSTAAAAGGSMLVRADALAKAGGMAAIRNALIDDCTLAAILKAHGPIWIGLTERVHSIRSYPGFGDIRRMVSRSAYAQLHYSPLLLAGTVVGMALTYLAPVALALFGTGLARIGGLAAWLIMALAFQPTLRLYRVSVLWGLALPAIAFCYVLFTLDSALQFALGRGGLWKGRVQASRPQSGASST